MVCLHIIVKLQRKRCTSFWFKGLEFLSNFSDNCDSYFGNSWLRSQWKLCCWVSCCLTMKQSIQLFIFPTWTLSVAVFSNVFQLHQGHPRLQAKTHWELKNSYCWQKNHHSVAVLRLCDDRITNELLKLDTKRCSLTTEMWTSASFVQSTGRVHDRKLQNIN